MACERKSNNRNKYAIMSSISVVVFLSLAFTLTPFSQAFTQSDPPYLYLSAESLDFLVRVDFTPVTTMYQEAYAEQQTMNILSKYYYEPILASAFLVIPTTIDMPPPDPLQYFELKYSQGIELEFGFIPFDSIEELFSPERFLPPAYAVPPISAPTNFVLSHDNVNMELELDWDAVVNADEYIVQRLSTARQIQELTDIFGDNNFAASVSPNAPKGDNSGFDAFDIPTEVQVKTGRFGSGNPAGGQVIGGYWLNVINGGVNQREADARGEVEQTGFMVSAGTRLSRDCNAGGDGDPSTGAGFISSVEQDGYAHRADGTWFDGDCRVVQRFLGTELKNLTVAETANAEVNGAWLNGTGFFSIIKRDPGSSWVFSDSTKKWSTFSGNIEQASWVLNQTWINVTTTTLTNFDDTNVNNYNTYFYRIIPTNVDGDGPISNILNGTLSIRPNRVNDLNGTDNGTTVDLNWEEATIKFSRVNSEDPVQGYIIQRATGTNETTIYDGLSHDVEEFYMRNDGGLSLDSSQSGGTGTSPSFGSDVSNGGQMLNITQAVNITRMVVKFGTQGGEFNTEPDIAGSIHFGNGTQITRTIFPRLSIPADVDKWSDVKEDKEHFVNWAFSPPVQLQPGEYIFGWQSLNTQTCNSASCGLGIADVGDYEVFFETTGYQSGSPGYAVGHIQTKAASAYNNPLNNTKDKDYAMAIYAEPVWETIGTNLGVSNTSFTDNSPPIGVTKAYRILSFNDAGISHPPTLLHNPQGTLLGLMNNVTDFFPVDAQGRNRAGGLIVGEVLTFVEATAGPVPDQVTGLVITQEMNNNATLDWDDALGADNYQVLRNINFTQGVNANANSTWQFREQHIDPSDTNDVISFWFANPTNLQFKCELGECYTWKTFPRELINGTEIDLIYETIHTSTSGLLTYTTKVIAYNATNQPERNDEDQWEPKTAKDFVATNDGKLIRNRNLLLNSGIASQIIVSGQHWAAVDNSDYATILFTIRDANVPVIQNPRLNLISLNFTDVVTGDPVMFINFSNSIVTNEIDGGPPSIPDECQDANECLRGTVNVGNVTVFGQGFEAIGTSITSDFEDSTLPLSNLATYKVRGNNTVGFGLNSTEVDFGLIQPINNLNATALNTTAIQLSWDLAQTVHPTDPLTGVLIQRNGTTITTVDELDTSFIDTGLLPTTNYEYRLKGVSAVSTGAFGTESDATTLGAGPVPDQVTGLVITQEMNNNATMDWDDATGADNYQVLRKTNFTTGFDVNTNGTWSFREQQTDAQPTFNPNCTFLTFSDRIELFHVGSGSDVGECYMFKTFPREFLNGSQIQINYEFSNTVGSNTGTFISNTQNDPDQPNRNDESEWAITGSRNWSGGGAPDIVSSETESATLNGGILTADVIDVINDWTGPDTDYSTIIVEMVDGSILTQSTRMKIFWINVTDFITGEPRGFYNFSGSSATLEPEICTDGFDCKRGFFNVGSFTITNEIFEEIGTPITSDFEDSTIPLQGVSTYKVRANNTVGFGLNSTEVDFGLIQTIKNLNATALNTTAIKLSWDLAQTVHPTDPLTGVLIQRNGTTITTVDELDTSFIDTGLLPTTNYEYRLKGVSAVSTGAFGTESDATTLGVVPSATLKITKLATGGDDIFNFTVNGPTPFNASINTGGLGSGIQTDNLAAYYTFDNNNINNDTALNFGTLGSNADAKHLNFTNDANLPFFINSSSILNEAMRQNGTQQPVQTYVKLGEEADASQWNFLVDQNSDWSMNFWLLGDVVGGTIYNIMGDRSLDNTVLVHGGNGDGSIAVQMFQNGVEIIGDQNTNGAIVPDDGNFHMVTILVNKTLERNEVCIDGSSNCVTSPSTWSNSFGPLVGNYSEALTIGKDSCNPGSTCAFPYTQIDDLGIWDDLLLTDTEIDTLYNNGLGSPAGNGSSGMGMAGPTPVDPGTYNVTETVPAGWNLTNATCNDGSSSFSVDTVSGIVIGAGNNVECTFEDELISQSTLTITKNATGGDATFNFTVTGPTNFTANITTINGTGMDGPNTVDAGTYSVQEMIPAGWNLTNAFCNDGFSSFVIDTVLGIIVDPGDNIECTFEDIIIPTCNGLTATMVGTDGNDFIMGTPADDVIVGLEGDDVILGNGGNDTICGGPGQDYITGGAGADTIFGEGGKDLLNGRGGADTIDGGPGDDVIVGRNGNDILTGGGGDDHISGENGNDTIEGNGGADHLSGGDGNDNIRGRGGDDVISGGDGDDDLDGDAGSDTCIDTVGTNTFTQCESIIN